MGFIRSTLGHVTGLNLFKKQVDYTKFDLSGLVDGAKACRSKLAAREKAENKEKAADDWNTVVLNYGVNTIMMVGQYRKRRVVSVLLGFTFFMASYFVIVDSRFFMGLPSVVFSLIFYLNNALRLYQIRNRELCKWSAYFSAIKVSFKELLPLALPADWQLMQAEKKENKASKAKEAQNTDLEINETEPGKDKNKKENSL